LAIYKNHSRGFHPWLLTNAPLGQNYTQNSAGEAQSANQRLNGRSAPPGSQSALPDGLLHEVERAGIHFSLLKRSSYENLDEYDFDRCRLFVPELAIGVCRRRFRPCWRCPVWQFTSDVKHPATESFMAAAASEESADTSNAYIAYFQGSRPGSDRAYGSTIFEPGRNRAYTTIFGQ
jgi:hypothetical protein